MDFFFSISANLLKKQRKAPLVHMEYTRSNSLTTDPTRNNPQNMLSMFFGDKGDRNMAFLSALVEDHRRWDMIEDCEL